MVVLMGEAWQEQKYTSSVSFCANQTVYTLKENVLTELNKKP